MRTNTSLAVSLTGFAVLSFGCNAAPGTTGAGAALPALSTGTDAGAMADLQASPEWMKPRCRWLETSAHMLFYAQDTAVLMAARDLGYADVQEVGTGNRTGRPEPAWSVALTEAGRAESAKCGEGSSRSEVFGVPVSGRRFLSAKRTGAPDMYTPNRTMFEVEFEWTPTAAGNQVKHVLTSHMAVEQGLATARVAMLHGKAFANKGSNGWAVEAIHDSRFTTRRP